MSWIFLILASCCEVLWFYCIAYLTQIGWKDLSTFSFIHSDNGFWVIAAILGYAGFGVFNMLFFSKAIQKIAPAVAFAVWTGLALVGITISDAIFKGINFNYWQAISIICILIGIVGIKAISEKA